MHFYMKLIGFKSTTQNDFVYGELGRVKYAIFFFFIIVRYLFKVLNTPENKYYCSWRCAVLRP